VNGTVKQSRRISKGKKIGSMWPRRPMFGEANIDTLESRA
jgi:hypothetical protein